MKISTFQFGQWLKSLRKERRLTREAIALRSGGRISQQYVHFIETGKATNIGHEKLMALADGLSLPVEILQQALNTGAAPEIPVLGRVAAGLASHPAADEYRQETLTYAAADTGPHPLYAMEIMGDSMAPKLEHGDLALVRRYQPDETLHAGHIYVFRKDRRLTCKYLVEKDAQWWLAAEKPELFVDTPLADGYHIAGKVVEVRKTLTLNRPVC